MRHAASWFRGKIAELWHIRQRELVWSLNLPGRRGRRPLGLSWAKREALLAEAMGYARDALQPLARHQFMKLTCDKLRSRRTPDVPKGGRFNWSTVEDFIDGLPELESPYHVYVFWKGDTCTYVGQSKRGHWGGGGKWERSVWRNSDYIQVFATARRRDLDKFECLAMDRFRPLHNLRRAPDRRHHTKCPVHEILWYLEGELRTVYAMRH